MLQILGLLLVKSRIESLERGIVSVIILLACLLVLHLHFIGQVITTLIGVRSILLRSIFIELKKIALIVVLLMKVPILAIPNVSYTPNMQFIPLILI